MKTTRMVPLGATLWCYFLSFCCGVDFVLLFVGPQFLPMLAIIMMVPALALNVVEARKMEHD